MDKYNVIAHCADGDVIIGKDGVNDVTLDEAAEIVDAHKNMGVELSIEKVVRGYTPRGETICWFASPTDAMIFLTGKKKPDISSITKAISQNTTYKNLKWEYDRIKPNTDTIS